MNEVVVWEVRKGGTEEETGENYANWSTLMSTSSILATKMYSVIILLQQVGRNLGRWKVQRWCSSQPFFEIVYLV